MVVIGIDPHKDTRADCLVDPVGRPLAHRSIADVVAVQREPGPCAHDVAVRTSPWRARTATGAPRQSHSSKRASEVMDVPAQMTAAARRSQRTATKCDETDSFLIPRLVRAALTFHAALRWRYLGVVLAGRLPR